MARKSETEFVTAWARVALTGGSRGDVAKETGYTLSTVKRYAWEHRNGRGRTTVALAFLSDERERPREGPDAVLRAYKEAVAGGLTCSVPPGEGPSQADQSPNVALSLTLSPSKVRRFLGSNQDGLPHARVTDVPLGEDPPQADRPETAAPNPPEDEGSS